MQPDFKFKNDLALEYQSVEARLHKIGRERFPTTGLTEEEKWFTVSREFFSKKYGGNSQATFPNIDENKLVKHGLENNWGFLNLDFNPNAPQHPGDPGLFFTFNPAWKGQVMVKRIFVRMNTSKWLYIGKYKFTPTDPLKGPEFSMQNEKVSVYFVGCQELFLSLYKGQRDMGQARQGHKVGSTYSGPDISSSSE